MLPYGWTEAEADRCTKALDPEGKQGYTREQVAVMLGDPRQERKGDLFIIVGIVNQLMLRAEHN